MNKNALFIISETAGRVNGYLTYVYVSSFLCFCFVMFAGLSGFVKWVKRITYEYSLYRLPNVDY